MKSPELEVISTQKMNSPKGFSLFLTGVAIRYVFPVVSLVRGLEFRVAQSASELDAAYKLGWDVYGRELGYINPDDYPNQRYSDKYDKYSVVFICFLKGKPVGTLRLIFDSNYGFYIERDFPIISPAIPRNKITELSRFVVLKECRGGAHLISFGLLRAALKLSQSHGITHWYALMGEGLKKSFDRYGVSIDLLPYRELTEQQIEERRLMEHYYKVVKPLPYIISLEGMKKMI